MKNKFIINLFLVLFYLSNTNNLSANELTFDTTTIEISDNGNIINATKGIVKSIEDKIEIKANKFKYNKDLFILYVTDGIAKSTESNIEIKANNFEYNKNLSILNAFGDVEIKDLKKNVLLKSENIFYNLKNRNIRSDTESTIDDDLGNFISMKSFNFNIDNSLIKVNDVKLIDIKKNVLQSEKAYINLNSNKLIGKDISINLINEGFEKDNEPRLKGNSVISDANESIIQKGVFTTCKKNDDCPPWQLSAEEIKHNKKKKTIYYKNAWLKLYDKPVFYFPKFFHPDPTVKRQSGFLMPSIGNSSTLGSSLNIPYYNVLANNKDLTITPRLYTDDNALLQSEYRQINAKSDHILDLSLMTGKNISSKSHFFSKSTKRLDFANFDESTLNLQIQQTSDDTYLKTHKLKSPLINDNGLLTSTLGLSAYREDLSFDTNVHVYEDLSKKNTDRYEFILPDYNIYKELNNNTDIDGTFSINSSGYMKNYDTNIFEKVIINDLLFDSSAQITNSGFKNNYSFLIKNINTDADKSKKYKQTRDHKIASIIQYKSSYPLQKEKGGYNNILNPMVSFKFSPNNSRNMREDDKKIDVTNIFSFNRLGVNDSVEGGASITYGTEFSKTSKLTNQEVFKGKIANIFRIEEDNNLPNNIGKKTSDIVAGLIYEPNSIFKMNYNFSLDNNLDDTNHQMLETQFRVNNFITSFEYLNQNNTINKESYLSNKTTYNFDDTNSLRFEIRENKKTNLTEYYNLIYQYRNDCLIAAIEYNKDYYSVGDLKPEENLFFKLTIIPFGQANSPSLKK
jgi:LPS-assembly protein